MKKLWISATLMLLKHIPTVGCAMRTKITGNDQAIWVFAKNATFLSATLMLLTSLVAISQPVWAGPGAHGPNGEHLDVAVSNNPTGLQRLADGSVHVPKAAQRRMAVRTVMAQTTEAAATIALSGKVVLHPNASGKVQATHGGKIEVGPQGLPVAGQTVRKGQILGYVRHHSEPYALANQQNNLAEIQARRLQTEQTWQRLQALEGSVPGKDVTAAKIELDSLRQREQQLLHSLQAREALRSPIDGVIARADLVPGQVVESQDVLFEIINPKQMLLEVSSNDASLPARIAHAQLPGMPEVTVQLIGAARSLRDGVLPITFSLQHAQGIDLAVNQAVTLVVQLKDKTQGIVLPAAAVVRNPNNEPVVWIKSGAQRFIPQPVQYRMLDAHQVVIIQGLAADNRVVVQGAALIAQIR